MNNIYKYLILIALAFTFSCTDLLNEEAETFLISENVYSSEDGANKALNGLYATLIVHEYYRNSYYLLFSLCSGDMYAKHGNNPSQENGSLSTTPENKWNNQVYAAIYTSIAAANDIIVNLEGKTDISEKVRNAVLGDAYFLRGFNYFNLVRAWGGVPIRIEPTATDDIHIGRASEQEVYDQVISDLEEAYELMPEAGDEIKGRPHKWAAKALLAKVYLTMASKSLDAGSPYYEKARDEALDVFEHDIYQLVPTYQDLWDLPGNNTQEAIFEIQESKDNLANLIIHRTFMPRDHWSLNGNTAWDRVRVNKEAFDVHVNRYPDDPRIDETFIHSYYINNIGDTIDCYPVNAETRGWPWIYKHRGSDYDNIRNSDRNFVVFRYAELLLILAEAENMINGPANAYQYVNRVLSRARLMPDGSQSVEPVDWSNMNQSEFHERIIQERKFELLGEGDAFFENRRHGREYLLNLIQNHNSYPGFVVGEDFEYLESDRTYFLPIPSNELNANELINLSDQNPGY